MWWASLTDDLNLQDVNQETSVGGGDTVWQSLAILDRLQGFPGVGLRLPSGNLWQPLASFGTLWQPLKCVLSPRAAPETRLALLAALPYTPRLPEARERDPRASTPRRWHATRSVPGRRGGPRRTRVTRTRPAPRAV